MFRGTFSNKANDAAVLIAYIIFEALYKLKDIWIYSLLFRMIHIGRQPTLREVGVMGRGGVKTKMKCY